MICGVEVAARSGRIGVRHETDDGRERRAGAASRGADPGWRGVRAAGGTRRVWEVLSATLGTRPIFVAASVLCDSRRNRGHLVQLVRSKKKPGALQQEDSAVHAQCQLSGHQALTLVAKIIDIARIRGST